MTQFIPSPLSLSLSAALAFIKMKAVVSRERGEQRGDVKGLGA